MAHPCRICHFLAAALQPLLASAVLMAGEPCALAPPPPQPCSAPAAEVLNTLPAKIVVNVPPPEVVYQEGGEAEVSRPRCGLFRRRQCGKSYLVAPAPASQTVATLVSPVSTTTFGSLGFLGAQGFNPGVANFAVTGAPAVVPMAINPALVQQASCGQIDQAAAFQGLRAIHAAEVRTAAIVASRAQQDAELTAMVAALDRAKGSMAAVASANGRNGAATSASATSTAVSQAVAAATATAATASALAKQLDAVQVRLNAIEKQVDILTKTTDAIIDKVAKPEK